MRSCHASAYGVDRLVEVIHARDVSERRELTEMDRRAGRGLTTNRSAGHPAARTTRPAHRRPRYPLLVAPYRLKAKRLIERLRNSRGLQGGGPRSPALCIGKHVLHEGPGQPATSPLGQSPDGIYPAVAFVQEAPGTSYRRALLNHHPRGQACCAFWIAEVSGRNWFIAGGPRGRGNRGADGGRRRGALAGSAVDLVWRGLR